MRKFSDDQKDLYYLSPYTAVKKNNGYIFMHQRLFDVTDILMMSSAAGDTLLNKLGSGITETQLKDLLSADGFTTNPDCVITRWMQMGILE